MAFEAGKMIRIKSSSTLVRRDPSTANPYIGRFYSGNMFLCAGTSGNWIKIRWGNRDKREYAYVPMNDAEELSVSTSYPLVPILNMALSFAQNGGSLSGKEIESGNLELGGEWCQTFLYWLCNAAGLYGSSNFPAFNKALCRESKEFFENKGRYYAASGFQPQLGDWIYYKKNGSADAVSHIGLVNDYYNNKISTVEGNWGNPRCVRIFDDAATEHNGYTIIGFARPVYA